MALLVSAFFLLFYVFFQSSSIYGGDAGDLVTAAYVRGVPHPPGYPLYTFVGWLLTRFAWSTVAWRVTLLSSIPSAVSLGLLYLILRKIVRSRFIGLLSVFILGFSYLFWLYASVPEVFALNTLFSLVILYVLLLFKETKNIKLLYLAGLIFGLALSHHHTIILLMPGYVWLIWPAIKKLLKEKRIWIYCVLAIILGMLPYIYVAWAARSNPVVNWEDPKTLTGFIRLVSRALYGTFKSNQGAGQIFLERILNLKIAGEMFLIDFTKVGLVLTLTGAFVLYKQNKHLFWTILLLFAFSGPLFLFYSSFPIALNFNVATMERFLLLPYVFISVWIAYGIQGWSFVLDKYLKRLTQKFRVSTVIIFTLIPLVLLLTNFPKIAPLKNDRTAENYARDLLNTAPNNAILLTVDDTSTFNLLYFYYTTGGAAKNRGIKLIQYSLTDTPFYINNISKAYPELGLDRLAAPASEKILLALIAEKFYSSYPILCTSRAKIGSDNFGWLPEGLLYKMYKYPETHITLSEYKQTIEPLFQKYQDPLEGALGRYKHIMLADVLREYSNAHFETGKEYAQVGELNLAENHLISGIRYQPDNTDISLKLVEVETAEEKCTDAEKILVTLRQTQTNNPEIYRLLAEVYRSCYKNETKAAEYQKQYESKLNQSQTQLKQF